MSISLIDLPRAQRAAGQLGGCWVTQKMKRRIIALHGGIGSGKTYLAELLVKDYGFVRLSFSTPLKKIGLIMGFTEEEMYKDKEHVNQLWGVSGRHFLRYFGTEVCSFSLAQVIPEMKFVWARLLGDEIDKTDKDVVVDDLRFLHELAVLQLYDASIVYVDGGESGSSSHLSDQSLEKMCQFTICNDHYYTDLKLKTLLSEIDSSKADLEHKGDP